MAYNHQPHPETRIPASHMESHGNSRLWTDPDYMPGDGDAGLPMLSTVGRGPRGEGIMVEVDETEDSYSFILRSDITGEVFCESGNLSAGTISIRQDLGDMNPGEDSIFYIDITRGGATVSYPITVPTGAAGSHIFLLDYVVTVKESSHGVHTCTESDFEFYGTWNFLDKCPVRVGDTVMAQVKTVEGSNGLGIGTVLANKEGKVTYSLKVIIPYLVESDDSSPNIEIKLGEGLVWDEDGAIALSGHTAADKRYGAATADLYGHVITTNTYYKDSEDESCVLTQHGSNQLYNEILRIIANIDDFDMDRFDVELTSDGKLVFTYEDEE